MTIPFTPAYIRTPISIEFALAVNERLNSERLAVRDELRYLLGALELFGFQRVEVHVHQDVSSIAYTILQASNFDMNLIKSIKFRKTDDGYELSQSYQRQRSFEVWEKYIRFCGYFRIEPIALADARMSSKIPFLRQKISTNYAGMMDEVSTLPYPINYRYIDVLTKIAPPKRYFNSSRTLWDFYELPGRGTYLSEINPTMRENEEILGLKDYYTLPYYPSATEVGMRQNMPRDFVEIALKFISKFTKPSAQRFNMNMVSEEQQERIEQITDSWWRMFKGHRLNDFVAAFEFEQTDWEETVTMDQGF